MGIKGASQFLEKRAERPVDDRHGVDAYRGNPIAIDTSPGMYTTLTTMLSRPGELDDYSHAPGFLTRIMKMLGLGLAPIWFFSGEAPQTKSSILSPT